MRLYKWIFKKNKNKKTNKTENINKELMFFIYKREYFEEKIYRDKQTKAYFYSFVKEGDKTKRLIEYNYPFKYGLRSDQIQDYINYVWKNFIIKYFVKCKCNRNNSEKDMKHKKAYFYSYKYEGDEKRQRLSLKQVINNGLRADQVSDFRKYLWKNFLIMYNINCICDFKK